MTERATDSDAGALIEIELACFGPDAWSEALVLAELDAPSRSVLVARVTNTVAGYASLSVTADLSDLQRIAVRPQARGRGYGRALLEAALRTARNGGADRMLLEVAADNAAALGLYHAVGFHAIDRRVDYFGPERDALVLMRQLPA